MILPFILCGSNNNKSLYIACCSNRKSHHKREKRREKYKGVLMGPTKREERKSQFNHFNATWNRILALLTTTRTPTTKLIAFS